LNKSFSFNNTINIASAVPNPNFQNQTMAAFSYSAGIGVQKDITPHLQAGLGYEMLDFGQSGLGRAPEQTINSGINMDHLYMHTLLLSLTHRA
jgi:opacity protein-like surface antigen